jgi:hypothetical protein
VIGLMVLLAAAYVAIIADAGVGAIASAGTARVHCDKVSESVEWCERKSHWASAPPIPGSKPGSITADYLSVLLRRRRGFGFIGVGTARGPNRVRAEGAGVELFGVAMGMRRYIL